MLDDKLLQKAISKKEVACVVATSMSVLRTKESKNIGAYRTTISYFFHEGTLYSDAISVPTSKNAKMGYTLIAMDEFPTIG